MRTTPDYERISGQTGDNLYAQQWTTLQYRRGRGPKRDDPDPLFRLRVIRS